MYYIKHKGFDTTSLYAYTNSKKVAKEFSEQRNPKRLILLKRTNFSKEEWDRLCSTRPSLRIIEGHLYTKGEIFGSKKHVTVLCTEYEERMAVLHADDIWIEFSKYLFDGRAFKQEYLIALEKLLFIKLFCFYVIKRVQDADYFYEPYYSNFGPPEPIIYEDFQDYSCHYDELRVFLKMFKDTFAEDKG